MISAHRREEEPRSFQDDRELRSLRWRPGVRPIGTRDRQSDGVSDLEHPRRRIQLEGDLEDPSRNHGLRRRVGVAMGQVEDPPAHQHGSPIFQHVAELRGQECDGIGEAQGREQNRDAEDLQLLRDRPLVEQRVDLVRALIDRQSVGRVIGPADVRCGADVAACGEGLLERATRARGPKGKFELPASGEPTGQRPLRPAELLCRLLDRFPFQIAEQDREPVVFRQAVQFLVE